MFQERIGGPSGTVPVTCGEGAGAGDGGGGNMSQHSDEPQPGVSSDSFWEPGNYKRTARRIEDGYRLCDSLASMVAERAEMEKAYAKGLRGWAKKWSDLIEKGRSHSMYCTVGQLGLLLDAYNLLERPVVLLD